MQNIAVIGDRQSVQGFRSVGFDAFSAEDSYEAFEMLRKAVKDEYPIIFITENYAQELSETIQKYKSSAVPAIIPIPATSGNTGYGMAQIKKNVEKAVGADILFKE